MVDYLKAPRCVADKTSAATGSRVRDSSSLTVRDDEAVPPSFSYAFVKSFCMFVKDNTGVDKSHAFSLRHAVALMGTVSYGYYFSSTSDGLSS